MVLRERAPEGLIPWIREQKDIDWPQYLIYKAGWATEPITGQKTPCADAECTACGAKMKLDRAYSAKCLRGNAGFGVGWNVDAGAGYEKYGSGEHGFCPECGAKVEVLHSSCVNKLVSYVWPMSFERAGYDLICYLWRVERWIEKDGSVGMYASPWEDYVFDEKSAAVYKRWENGFFGTYYHSDTWKKLRKFEDRAYDIDLVYNPEGIEQATKGTWAENSKLEIYMGVQGEYRFPIVWLKLYQRRHKAETLMTCGAAKLTAGIIAEEKRAKNYYQKWTRKVDCLKDLDWRRKRPAEMLRVSKQELPYFLSRDKEDGTRRLMMIEQARKKGIAIRPGDEDGRMSLPDQLALLENGILPAKVRRYLDKQKRRYERDWDLAYLKDYWRMARQLGMDLNDEDVRWPQNLTGAHDRLTEQKKEMKEKLRQKDFEKRYKQLSRYIWEQDGILIRPARSAAELQKEGKALHHCVGGYAGKMVTGETAIFFIRRAASPDDSWFTLELDENKLVVRQNRGLRNCARTQEIKDFEEAWLAWARAGCKRKKGGKNGVNELATMSVKEMSPEQLGGEVRLLTMQARRMALSYGIQIGYRLHIAHEKVGAHGWAEWLKRETEFSAASASRFESLYEGYGEDQGSLFGVENKFPTLENLSISNALRLLAIPEEERESFAAEVGAEKLSARELDKAIAEKKAAEERAKALEQERDTARQQLQTTEARLEDTQKELSAQFTAATELNRKLTEAREGMQEEAAEAEKNERELKARIKELESRPIEVAVQRDEKAIEEAVQQAKADASAEWAEKVKKLQEDLEKANAQKDKLKAKVDKADAAAAEKLTAAEQERARIEQELEAARKKLKTSDANVAKFGVYFRAMQEDYNKLLELLPEIGETDRETAEKLRGGARVLIVKMLERLGGGTAPSVTAAGGGDSSPDGGAMGEAQKREEEE